jgi:hypothetical protein
LNEYRRGGENMSISAAVIAISVGVITHVINGVVDDIKEINSEKAQLKAIRDVQIPRIWPDRGNVDSNTFCQRLEELDNDIQVMLNILDDYVEVLRRSAREYENTQREVNSKAGALKSPRSR